MTGRKEPIKAHHPKGWVAKPQTRLGRVAGLPKFFKQKAHSFEGPFFIGCIKNPKTKEKGNTTDNYKRR